jgi:histidinol-phosphatase (PHP family)
MKRDNHIHTNYCPHASSDSIEMYIKEALSKGLKELTFTEHAPLPIKDSVPTKDSAMRMEDVERYISTLKDMQHKYAERIRIHIGFEVDYIEGYEKETIDFLKKYPECIEYSILSVHFLQLQPNDYFCIDYDSDSFIQKGTSIGFETMYRRYEETLTKALSLPFGEWTPKKIGHLNLIHKFQKAYIVEDPIQWEALMDLAKMNHYRLDYNFSGMDKPLYQKTYPNADMMMYAKKIGLNYETGSDAHQAKDIGRYFSSLEAL